MKIYFLVYSWFRSFCHTTVYTSYYAVKGTLSRASLQIFKNAKTHFTATETYEYCSSFVKNYNASVMKLKKSSITVIPPGAQDRNVKK